PLSDGAKMEIPKGVTVMIDAGAVFKLRSANIDVGSSAQGIDRSGGAVQVLGTPKQSVYFSSFNNTTLGANANPLAATPSKGDWGGLVFRDDSDQEKNGVFLNYVNHANMTYGGGQVLVNSVLAVYDPIHMVTSRPTVSYNTITNSADAAISANPNSFEETEFQSNSFTADYTRVGPSVHGNTVTANSINALFIRIQTQSGQNLDPLTVFARFDDTDIVHVLQENLQIQGDAGNLQLNPTTNLLEVRKGAKAPGRLSIDPGTLIKLSGARIETQLGANFFAEGTESNPVVFTSLNDDRYGASGAFDTTGSGKSVGAAGDWSGLFFGPLSTGSVDHALITFGGGSSTIEGGF